MSAVPDPAGRGNPFATRRVRPGAVPFLFPEGASADVLVTRLRQAGWRGQIVGSHGSGKSTLLAALIPAIERAGRRVVHVALHDGQRRLPADALGKSEIAQPTVLVVDGYEQLGWFARLGARWLCRRRGWGFVATCHEPVRLPVLWTAITTPARVRQIVAALLEDDWSRIAPEEVDAAFARHGDNVRETLFELYDLYQRRMDGIFKTLDEGDGKL
ncbi:MAG: hypothetical protein JW809_11425 [Pirellulales bacterium]|nr:hypothetical protein [Pirellulales bacterium]